MLDERRAAPHAAAPAEDRRADIDAELPTRVEDEEEASAVGRR